MSSESDESNAEADVVQDFTEQTFSEVSIRGGEEGFRLKDFTKGLPTLEHIESVIAAEEKAIKELEEAKLKALLAAEQAAKDELAKAEAEKGEDEIKAEQSEEPIEEAHEDEEEVVEDIEEVEEKEEEQEEDDFDKIKEDEPETAKADEEVFTGFEEDEKKHDSEEASVVEVIEDVLTLDPKPVLEDIISKVVEKAEHRNMDAMLRKKLDRGKMLTYIANIWPSLSLEQKKGQLLNRKVVEYFRRKKYERALIEDNPVTVIDAIKKYRDNLLRLDDIKAKKQLIEEDVDKKLEELKIQENILINESEKGEEVLAQLLRDTGAICFSKKTGQYLPEKTIEILIRKTSILRDQISDLRLALIESQHKMAFLLDKAKKLEDLGNGLCQADFEQLRAETQGLGDKIEERNNEVSKLRVRCNSDTHILSNIREKLDMLANGIEKQEHTLEELQDEQVSCRNFLQSVKLERDHLRRQFSNMSFECGLLDKPLLLFDFDSTVDKVDETERRVDQLIAEKNKYTDNLNIILSKLK